ncbi:Alpha-(1 3)-fucosyltransferase FucT-like 2 [Homarus americanus]|uniref:Alpha-(1 3)-fucosyltransferase FucT-like 2 n=1 Tax=Homarus americanus TaxID=6706 RepID=A0A8J5N570_HOMAM|nr:Alpha-(1 3)-fucosyltransferase FucT-like 2 [Homarus americanus]
MAMDMALEMDPNVDRSCTIIRNVKKDIRAYYEVFEEKRKNTQQMTLDAFITAKPSTPHAPTTPRTSKQNTAFRQLFKTSVKPQPSTSNHSLQRVNHSLQRVNHSLQRVNHSLQRVNHSLQRVNHSLQRVNHSLQRVNHSLQRVNHSLQRVNHSLQQANHSRQPVWRTTAFSAN